MEIKLKYTDINFAKALCGNPALPLKIEIRLTHIKRNVSNNTKNDELQN